MTRDAVSMALGMLFGLGVGCGVALLLAQRNARPSFRMPAPPAPSTLPIAPPVSPSGFTLMHMPSGDRLTVTFPNVSDEQVAVNARLLKLNLERRGYVRLADCPNRK